MVSDCNIHGGFLKWWGDRRNYPAKLTTQSGTKLPNWALISYPKWGEKIHQPLMLQIHWLLALNNLNKPVYIDAIPSVFSTQAMLSNTREKLNPVVSHLAREVVMAGYAFRILDADLMVIILNLVGCRDQSASTPAQGSRALLLAGDRPRRRDTGRPPAANRPGVLRRLPFGLRR